jgi:hypothetical protein
VSMMEGQAKKSQKLSCYMILRTNNELPRENHIFILITVSSGKRGKSHLIHSRKVQVGALLQTTMYFSMN